MGLRLPSHSPAHFRLGSLGCQVSVENDGRASGFGVSDDMEISARMEYEELFVLSFWDGSEKPSVLLVHKLRKIPCCISLRVWESWVHLQLRLQKWLDLRIQVCS
jgi:hypothetical protein